MIRHILRPMPFKSASGAAMAGINKTMAENAALALHLDELGKATTLAHRWARAATHKNNKHNDNNTLQQHQQKQQLLTKHHQQTATTPTTTTTATSPTTTTPTTTTPLPPIKNKHNNNCAQNNNMNCLNFTRAGPRCHTQYKTTHQQRNETIETTGVETCQDWVYVRWITLLTVSLCNVFDQVTWATPPSLAPPRKLRWPTNCARARQHPRVTPWDLICKRTPTFDAPATCLCVRRATRAAWQLRYSVNSPGQWSRPRARPNFYWATG